jgi:hypothetical protein
MDTYTITDSSCGSKSKWALVHLCTCKAAATRSNVYVSGKNNKILSIPVTMQGISTSAKSKEKRSKKKKLWTRICHVKLLFVGQMSAGLASVAQIFPHPSELLKICVFEKKLGERSKESFLFY